MESADSRGMISALSTAFSSTFRVNTQNQIGIAVARKVLDSAEAEGESVIRMISDAAAVGERARKSGLRISPIVNRGSIAASPGTGETGRGLDVTG